MMNILLVDDQIDVLNGLKRGVDWDRFHACRIFTAQSAIEARSYFANQKIHIMLCDIEMPNENGLSLCQWVKEQGYETLTIFLTAHASFSYAQRAVKLNCFDYILQPVQYSEVEEVLERAMQQINLNHDSNKELEIALLKGEESLRLGTMFEHRSASNEAYRQEWKDYLSKICEAEDTAILVLPIMIQIIRWNISLSDLDQHKPLQLLHDMLEQVLKPATLRYRLMKMTANGYFVLAYMSKNDAELSIQIIEDLHEKFSESVAMCAEKHGVDIAMKLDSVMPVEDFLQQVDTMRTRIRAYASAATGVQLREKGVFSDAVLPKLPDIKAWQEMMASGQAFLARAECIQCCERLQKNGEMTEETLRALYQNLVQAFYVAAQNCGYHADMLFKRNDRIGKFLLNRFRNIDMLYEFLDQMVIFFDEIQSVNIDRTAVEEASDFIRKNIHRNLSRREIAEHVHLSSEHLSRCFTAQNGITLKGYILKTKMEFAAKLLQDTGMSVGIIAAKVGFDSQSHFAQVFKREMGSSPLEYREKTKK